METLDLMILILPIVVALAISTFQRDQKAYLKKFTIIFAVGLICATIPWFHFGIFLGYYAYTLNAAFLAAIMDFKEFK